MEVITASAQETEKLGEKIGNILIKTRLRPEPVGNPARQGKKEKALIIALSGELGSGKTTFVKGLASGLGIPHRILSPTFIIVKRYPMESDYYHWFYHIDLYRIEAKGPDGLGLTEILIDPTNIVAIEWPEKLGNLLPKARIDIFFEENGDNKRKIQIEGISDKLLIKLKNKL